MSDELLTQEELRELAEAGDVEAQAELELLAEEEATEMVDTPEDIDALDAEQDAADELARMAQEDGVGYDPDESDLNTHDGAAYVGDRVLVDPSVAGGATGVVRVANGEGRVTLEDGRRLSRDQYLRLL